MNSFQAPPRILDYVESVIVFYGIRTYLASRKGQIDRLTWPHPAEATEMTPSCPRAASGEHGPAAKAQPLHTSPLFTACSPPWPPSSQGERRDGTA
ncbi:uncharacterized protein CLUP02_00410 [Colletotrichum lupini]|uniref:Uncharacterized protein n=1 Tax=Colletotrichum lupini TaxID=145971 RepID=A0A9Q8W835_9PEZI|nr:uncharacterized protein CLUP02_00410 [Colletotrichum lupini]UQC73764.1 hypothetical protein CLUP02_00410 [Colletotrichum lupini]